MISAFGTPTLLHTTDAKKGISELPFHHLEGFLPTRSRQLVWSVPIESLISSRSSVDIAPPMHSTQPFNHLHALFAMLTRETHSMEMLGAHHPSLSTVLAVDRDASPTS